jgi:hypothetical protein
MGQGWRKGGQSYLEKKISTEQKQHHREYGTNIFAILPVCHSLKWVKNFIETQVTTPLCLFFKNSSLFPKHS